LARYRLTALNKKPAFRSQDRARIADDCRLVNDPSDASSTIPARFTAHGVLRLNCPAASTTVPAMKESIILVSALSVSGDGAGFLRERFRR
jgi:hypothetical protein